MQIMDLMMSQRGYNLTEDANKKAKELMISGSSKKDFGNGRYVRNIVEQAIMKQTFCCWEHSVAVPLEIHHSWLQIYLAKS